MHPGWDEVELYNDICLLKLKTPISFRSGVQPICLRQGSEWVKPGTECVVSGWGTTISM